MTNTFKTKFVLDGDERGAVRAAKVTKQAVTGLNNTVIRFGAAAAAAGRNFELGLAPLATLLPAVGAGVAGAFAVGNIKDFTAEMARVHAILRPTDEQLAELTETARALGATTQFSAAEAAQAIVFLGQAGFKADQILQALPATLNLAAIEALDLGTAADIASNVLSGFRLPVEDTTRVVDVLARSSNIANTNVVDMGEAMKFVAPVAASLDQPLEILAASVGVLGNNAIKSTSAGTGLRTILVSLAAPTDKAREALERLGLTTDQVNPATNDLSTIIRRFADANLNAADAAAIFGREALSSVLALTANADQLDEYNQSLIQASGTAKESANIIADTLTGDLASLGSAAAEVALQIGDRGLEQSLRDLTQTGTNFLRSGAITNGIERIGIAVDTTIDQFRRFDGVIVSTETSYTTLVNTLGQNTEAGGLSGFIEKVSNELAILPVSIRTAFAVALGEIDILLANVGLSVEDFVGPIPLVLQNIAQGAFGSVRDAAELAFLGIKRLAVDLGGALEESIGQVIDELKVKLADLVQPIADLASTVGFDDVAGFFGGLAGDLRETANAEALATQERAESIASIDAQIKAVKERRAEFAKEADARKDAIRVSIDAALAERQAALENAKAQLEAANAKSQVGQASKTAKTETEENTQAANANSEALQEQIRLSTAASLALDDLSELHGTLAASLEGPVDKALREYQERLSSIEAVEQRLAAANALTPEAKQRITEARALAGQVFEQVLTQHDATLAAITDVQAAAVDSVIAVLGDFAATGAKSFKDLRKNLKSIAQGIVSDLIQIFLREQIVIPVAAQFTGVVGDLSGLASGGGGGIGGLLQGVDPAGIVAGGPAGTGSGATPTPPPAGGLLGQAGGLLQNVGTGALLGSLNLFGGGGTGSTLGGALGGGVGGFVGGGLGKVIGSVFGSFIGGLFGGKRPRARIGGIDSDIKVNDSTDALIDTALGPLKISLRKLSEEDLAAIIDTLETFDGVVAQALGDGRIDEVTAQLRGFFASVKGKDLGEQDIQQLLAQRFNAVVSGLGGDLQALIGNAGNDIDAALQRLGDVLAIDDLVQAGGDLFGAGESVTTVVGALSEYQRANEVLAQTYNRLEQQTNTVQQILGLAGAETSRTGAELVAFADDLTQAAGGLDALGSRIDKALATFFDPTDVLNQQINTIGNAASNALAGVGIELEGLTKETFSGALQTALNSDLAPEAIAQWLNAADAYADLLALEEERARILGDEQRTLEAAAAAEEQEALRVEARSQLVANALTLLGSNMELAGDGLDAFATDLVGAVGSIDDLNRQLQTALSTFLGDDVIDRQIGLAGAAAESALADVGLNLEGLTRENFTAALDAALNTNLAPGALAQWLAAAEAYAAVLALEEERTGQIQQEAAAIAEANQARAAAQAEFFASIDEQLAQLTLSPFELDLRSINQAYDEQLARLNQLNLSAEDFANAEQRLGRIRSIQIQQLLDEVTGSIRSLNDQLFGSGSTSVTTGINNVATATNNLFADWSAALDGIQGAINGALLNPNLSPLSSQERLAEAQSQFDALATAAEGGDIGAAQALPQAFNTLLQLAREVEQSGGDFNAIFDAARSRLEGINAPAGSLSPPSSAQVGAIGTTVQSINDSAAEQIRIASQIVQQLGFANELSPLTALEIAAANDVAIERLVQVLGVDLVAPTIESVTQLGIIADQLGDGLGGLADTVGLSIGNLEDAQSLLNDALEQSIESLPTQISEPLLQALRAVETAASAEEQAAANAQLEALVADLSPELRNQLAPFFDAISITTEAGQQVELLGRLANAQLDSLDLLASIRDGVRGLDITLGALPTAEGTPQFDVGTDRITRSGLATVHTGETVLTPDRASALRSLRTLGVPAAGGGDATSLTALLQEMRQLNSMLEAQSTKSLQAGQQFNRTVNALEHRFAELTTEFRKTRQTERVTRGGNHRCA